MDDDEEMLNDDKKDDPKKNIPSHKPKKDPNTNKKNGRGLYFYFPTSVNKLFFYFIERTVLHLHLLICLV